MTVFTSNYYFLKSAAVSAALFSVLFCTSKTTVSKSSDRAEVWLTKADESVKLQKQTDLIFNNASNNYQTLELDAAQKYQTIDGF